MFETKISTKYQVVFKAILMLILLAIVGCSIYFVYLTNKMYITELDRSMRLQTEASQTIVNRFKYVKLPDNPTPIAILPYEYNQDTSVLRLVSKINPLSPDYVPKNLQEVSMPHYLAAGPMMVRPEVNQALQKMNDAATKSGVYLMVRSGYRTYDLQQQLSLAANNDDTVAHAGQSEHQTGLAVDINSTPSNCIDNCGLDAKAAQWLSENAPTFGFILRYPAGKQDVTGYPTESWHFRYVGPLFAQALAKSGLTLDEAYKYIAN